MRHLAGSSASCRRAVGLTLSRYGLVGSVRGQSALSPQRAMIFRIIGVSRRATLVLLYPIAKDHEVGREIWRYSSSDCVGNSTQSVYPQQPANPALRGNATTRIQGSM